jgi:hypothetical protein
MLGSDAGPFTRPDGVAWDAAPLWAGRRRSPDCWRVNADHGAALAWGDSHVPGDEEGQPAEHLLLGQAGFAADEPPDPADALVMGQAGGGRPPAATRRAAV